MWRHIHRVRRNVVLARDLHQNDVLVRRFVGRGEVSSTGPADFGRAWSAADYVGIGLVGVLPERRAKRLLAARLVRIVEAPGAVGGGWRDVVLEVVEHDLTRDDLVSQFALAADIIRRHVVTPRRLRAWPGRAVVLRAENDPTQQDTDIGRYARLLGRDVTVIDMGQAGHAAALVDPEKYAGWIRSALTS